MLRMTRKPGEEFLQHPYPYCSLLHRHEAYAEAVGEPDLPVPGSMQRRMNAHFEAKRVKRPTGNKAAIEKTKRDNMLRNVEHWQKFFLARSVLILKEHCMERAHIVERLSLDQNIQAPSMAQQWPGCTAGPLNLVPPTCTYYKDFKDPAKWHVSVRTSVTTEDLVLYESWWKKTKGDLTKPFEWDSP
jgi:hypothetical protein